MASLNVCAFEWKMGSDGTWTHVERSVEGGRAKYVEKRMDGCIVRYLERSIEEDRVAYLEKMMKKIEEDTNINGRKSATAAKVSLYITFYYTSPLYD